MKRSLARVTLVTVAFWLGMCGVPALADDSWVGKGDVFLQKGNYDEAISCYKRAQTEEPANSARASDRLWQLYAKLHRYQEAQQVLTELISKTNSRDYKHYLAEIYQKSGNFYAAQTLFQDLLAGDAQDDAAMLGIAECHEGTGNYDAARDMYNKIVELGGLYAGEAKTALAKLQNASKVTSIDVDSEVGRWAQSRMPLKVYIQNADNTPGYRSHLRDCPVQAVADWQKASAGLIKMQIIDSPENADISVLWVQQIPSAIGLMRPRLTDDGEMLKATIYLACNSDSRGKALPAETPATRALYEARDRMMREVALHEMGHALGLDHSSRTDDIMASGVFGLVASDSLSARQLQPGDVERIVQLYSAPATVKAKDAVAAVSGGGKAGGEGDATETTEAPAPTSTATPQPAVTSQSSQAVATAAEPKDPLARAMQQALFALNQHKYEDCISTLQEVIRQSPKNAQAHYILAVAYVSIRNYAEAEKQYNAVLKLMPQGKLAQLAHDGLTKIGK